MASKRTDNRVTSEWLESKGYVYDKEQNAYTRPSVGATSGANCSNRTAGICATKPKPATPKALDRSASIQKAGAKRIAILVQVYRSRLNDPDNVCGKGVLDAIRYSGLIPDDRPEDITLQVTQTKCKKADQKTVITIKYPEKD